MNLYAYLSWFCTTFIDCNWRYMNHALTDEVLVNVPLSIALSVHAFVIATVLYVAINWLFGWLYVRKNREAWYDRGYFAGCQTKAVKFAQIRVGKEPQTDEIVLWAPDRAAIAEEADEAYVLREER